MAPKRTRRTPAELAEAAEAKARRAMAELKAERAKLARTALATFRMAEKNRFTRDWKAPTTTADQAVVPDLPTMQARARQLVRDNPIAASIVRSFVRNIVGRSGSSPSPAIELERGIPQVEANARLAWLWNRWALDPSLVDRQGRRSWAEVLSWAVSELVSVGEALVVVTIAEGLDGSLSPSLQLWEAEQLSLRVREWEGRKVVGGVELDDEQRALAYWLEPDPVGEWTLIRSADPVRIPAESVVHILDPQRANQTRGYSRLAPVANAIRDLGEYDSAQLLAARAEACIGLVIESDGLDSRSFEAEEGEEESAPPEFDFPKMSVARMLPGEKAVPFTPTRPGGSYEPFVRAQLRMIAAGVGLSYEQVARDFTLGSYSSARQAMLEDGREWSRVRSILEATLCRVVWREFVAGEVLRGSILLPGYGADPSRFEAVRWAWDGHEWIDPRAEVEAHGRAIELGLDTRERILRSRGLDYEETLAQYRRELEDFATAPASPPAVPPALPPGSQEPAPPVPDNSTETVPQ